MTNTKTADKATLISNILSRGTETIVPGKTELKTLLESGKKLNIYLGIDPTATHIHLGHAVPLRKLQQFAELGHTVYFLIGDFTAIIGDTSDKNSERPVLTHEEIEKNFQTYKKQASKILDFTKVKVVHNSEWLKNLGFDELLQLTSQFSVNDFISRELIRDRLKAGTRVSLSEVLYPIMQGYDSYVLDTDVQLGGTDQIFNMQAGRTLLKKLKQKESFVLSNGFLPGTDGRKMSKSWGNAIWLDDEPEDIFGKVMSLKDELIVEYCKLGTDMSDSEIEDMKKELETGNNPMPIKKKLGLRIVTELYDEAKAIAAEKHFAQSVQEKKAPDNIPQLEIASQSLSTEELITHIVEAKLATSKSEARRLLSQKALYLDDVAIDPQSERVELPQKSSVLRVGKRKYLQLLVR
jgi:tyrosyl-tRNA synthetase